MITHSLLQILQCLGTLPIMNWLRICLSWHLCILTKVADIFSPKLHAATYVDGVLRLPLSISSVMVEVYYLLSTCKQSYIFVLCAITLLRLLDDYIIIHIWNICDFLFVFCEHLLRSSVIDITLRAYSYGVVYGLWYWVRESISLLHRSVMHTLRKTLLVRLIYLQALLIALSILSTIRRCQHILDASVTIQYALQNRYIYIADMLVFAAEKRDIHCTQRCIWTISCVPLSDNYEHAIFE